MEDLSYRVQNEATKLLDGLDKEIFRKMMGDMHRCSAKCTDNTTATRDDVQNCMENCALPLQRAQNFMEQEIQNFQNRLDRCARDCQDKVRDKMSSPNPSETEQLQLREEMTQCVSRCADDQIKRLPDLGKRIRAHIKTL